MHSKTSIFVLLVVLETAAGCASWEQVAPGVEYRKYESESRSIHVARVDLTDPSIRVIATNEPERGMRTSEFASRYEAIVAINADYFTPDIRPIGLAVGPCGVWEGTRDTAREGVVAIGGERAEIHHQTREMDPPEEWIESAVSGWPALMKECRALDAAALPGSDSFTRSPHPRTAVGLSKDGRYLYLVVADGRQENARGLTLEELALFMAKDLGVCSAMNLDGGGSSVMVLNGEIVNRPSDGKERRVANHLAVVHADRVPDCAVEGTAETTGAEQ
jgi:exopolysaccharide biosynthesis protein